MAMLTPVILSAVFAVQASQMSAGLGVDPTKFDTQIDEAIVKHDLAFLTAVVADDARFMVSAANFVTKTQWFDIVKTYTAVEHAREPVNVEPHADVIVTNERVHLVTEAQSQPFDTLFLRVYVRRADRWLLLSQRTQTATRAQPPSMVATEPPPAG